MAVKQKLPENELLATREERLAEARKFNLLSDVFMTEVLKDPAACQHVLRIIMKAPDLVVKTVKTQYVMTKLVSHGVRLDVAAETEGGRICNIEIQRSDTTDHPRRIRYYGAMIDSEVLEKGKTYDQMPEVYIIYISETDIWKAGRTSYRVRKLLGEDLIDYEDGQHIIYVNAAVDDGSDIAKLMGYFKTADPDDMGHGALSERVHYLKCEKEGEQIMCEISERIYQAGMQRGIQQGIQQGIQKGIQAGAVSKSQTVVRNMFLRGMSAVDASVICEEKLELVEAWFREWE